MRESHHYNLNCGQCNYYVTYNSKDLYILLLFISHGCLIWSSWDHESNTESGQFRGSVFFLIISTNAIFYSNCTIVLICQLTCWLTWSTCWLMLTNIDQDLVNILTDSEQTYRPMGAFSTQGTRNLWLNLHCLFVVNFSLFVWSHMYTPNWSLSVLEKKNKVTSICNPLNLAYLSLS